MYYIWVMGKEQIKNIRFDGENDFWDSENVAKIKGGEKYNSAGVLKLWFEALNSSDKNPVKFNALLEDNLTPSGRRKLETILKALNID